MSAVNDPWEGKPHTREQWAVLRQRGTWGFVLRSPSAWGFFALMGVINPILALTIMGIDRGLAYAVPGFIGGIVGAIWIGRLFWAQCEEAWRADEQS